MLTAPEALCRVEIAAKLLNALGQIVTFVDVYAEAMHEVLSHTPVPARQDGLNEDNLPS